jgi:hypothetical protein
MAMLSGLGGVFPACSRLLARAVNLAVQMGNCDNFMLLATKKNKWHIGGVFASRFKIAIKIWTNGPYGSSYGRWLEAATSVVVLRLTTMRQ